jgi:hypothetical protein
VRKTETNETAEKPKEEKKSSSTLYVEERVRLIKDCIALMIEMLRWERREIEKIDLHLLRNMKKALENRGKDNFLPGS